MGLLASDSHVLNIGKACCSVNQRSSFVAVLFLLCAFVENDNDNDNDNTETSSCPIVISERIGFENSSNHNKG